MMRIRLRSASRTAWLAAIVAALGVAPPAGAVIIDSGDGTGNTSAPPACQPGPPQLCGDPGWDHMGIVNNLTAVYIRNGWMLTANHVAPGSVTLDGNVYAFVAGTAIQLDNGDGTFPDLKVFGITPTPPLAEMPIRLNPNVPSGEVIMIGQGHDRGAATDSNDPSIWEAPPNPPGTPIPGWLWGPSRSMRWGVNVVENVWLPDPFDTVSFYTVFDDPTSPSHETHEAQAAVGDSGGAIFADDGAGWELAGTMFVIALYDGHLNNSALRGEATIAADLSFYRDQILTLTAAEPIPEPDGLAGLGAGLLLLAALNRRRS